MPFDPLLPQIPALVNPLRVGSKDGPTRGRARGREWRRTTPGFVVPSWVDNEGVEQRILEEGHRLTRGVVTGWASLRLHRGAYFDGLAPDGRTRLPVPLLENGNRLTPSPSRTILRGSISPSDVELFRGVLRCATVERALLDEMRRLGDVRDAVVAADMCFAARITSLSRLRAWLEANTTRHGARWALSVLDHCDERSRSPQESRLRQIWEYDAGWGRPLCNVDVHDQHDAFIGRPDLLDPTRGVVGEYDGAEHRSRARHSRDVTREDGFRRVGLEVVTVVGEGLKDVPTLLSRLHEAEERARGRPRSFRWRT